MSYQSTGTECYACSNLSVIYDTEQILISKDAISINCSCPSFKEMSKTLSSCVYFRHVLSTKIIGIAEEFTLTLFISSLLAADYPADFW